MLPFVRDNERANVVVIKNEQLIQKGKVLEAILNVALLRGTSSIIYLAIPTILATTLDSEIFHRNGTGLIAFDDRFWKR